MDFFSICGFLKCAEIPLFIVFLNINQNWQKKGQKYDNFSHFAKHRLITKTRFVATPLFTKNCCFSTWFFETKNIDVEQKHNLSGNIKDKKKGFETKCRKPTKEKRLMKKNIAIEYFDVVPFMKQKKKEKERKRQKQGTKRKQKI